MKNINRAMVVGNLTRDANLRRTQSGLAVMELGVAVNDARRNPNTGEWEDYTNFLDCTMIGERAEKLAPKLAKGTKVCIEGKLRWSQWEKNGQKRSKVEILIDQIEYMSRQEREPQQEPEPQGVYDDDIPF